MKEIDINHALDQIEQHELIGSKVLIPANNIPMFAEISAILSVSHDDKPLYLTENGANSKELNEYIDNRIIELRKLSKKELNNLKKECFSVLLNRY